MILTILVSMLVYIFWFMKSEFQRILDRIDQSTLGIARMQRELTQSTVQQLNEQLQESFARLENDGEEDVEEEEGEEEVEEEEVEEEEAEEEGEENEENVSKDADPSADESKALEAVETVIEELHEVMGDSPKRRGRKPKK